MSVDPAVGRLTAALDRIVEVAFEPGQAGAPAPASYYPRLLARERRVREREADVEIRYLRDVFGLAGRDDLDGLDVLEVGSGFGVGLVAVACLLPRRARGVELLPHAVEWARRCIAELPPQLAERLEVQQGTATQLPLGDEEVDVILSLEAISHYYDYRPFLGEAARVLRPGGVLVISDGNNGLNPLIRRKTVQLWASHEEPPGPGRTHPPDYPFHFVDRRRELIEKAEPELSADETAMLALRTAGLRRDEVVAAARAYAASGAVPAHPYRRGELTVHPVEDMVMERLFNPYRLARELKALGFQTKVRGHWGGASGRKSVRLANRVLAAATPLTIFGARAFRIAAHKPR